VRPSRACDCLHCKGQMHIFEDVSIASVEEPQEYRSAISSSSTSAFCRPSLLIASRYQVRRPRLIFSGSLTFASP
jgi:hypothetical protein